MPIYNRSKGTAGNESSQAGGFMAEEKKAFDQIKYQNEFNKNRYDRITVLVPKGKKSEWTELAKSEGMSLTAWIVKKVENQ